MSDQEFAKIIGTRLAEAQAELHEIDRRYIQVRPRLLAEINAIAALLKIYDTEGRFRGRAVETGGIVITSIEPVAAASAPGCGPLSVPTLPPEPERSEAGAAAAPESEVMPHLGSAVAGPATGRDSVTPPAEPVAPAAVPPKKTSHKALTEEVWAQREQEVLDIMAGEPRTFSEFKRRITFPVGSLYLVFDRLIAKGKMQKGYNCWGPAGAAPPKAPVYPRGDDNRGTEASAPPANDPDDGLTDQQRDLVKVIAAAYDNGEPLLWGDMAERARIKPGKLGYALLELEKKKLIVRDERGIRPYGKAPPGPAAPIDADPESPTVPSPAKTEDEMIAEHLQTKGVTRASDEWPTGHDVVEFLKAEGIKLTTNFALNLFTIDGKKMWRDGVLSLANRQRLWKGLPPWASTRVRWPNENGAVPPILAAEGAA